MREQQLELSKILLIALSNSAQSWKATGILQEGERLIINSFKPAHRYYESTLRDLAETLILLNRTRSEITLSVGHYEITIQETEPYFFSIVAGPPSDRV